MNAFISLFTGGGGADLGAIAAGLVPVAGLEYDAAIADVARQNIGDHIRVGRVEDADYTTVPAAFWLHASPPCTTASQANANGGETALDMTMAQGICQAITTIKPRRFSLENVYGYRTYASFALILATLHGEGYAVNFWHLNSADYGVPQTRKRLILVASLDHTPRKPQLTHANPARLDTGQSSMFDSLPPWIGWYAAIADIAHTLPDSQFAPWQLARLPAELRTLLMRGDNSGQEWGKGWRDSVEPVASVVGNGKMPRALLVGGGNTNKTILDSTYCDACHPAYTTSPASSQDRALIVHPTNSRSLTVAESEEPIFTITAAPGFIPRASLLHGQNASTARPHYGPEPVHTITDTNKAPARAYIGRVVSATPRALARWQSVPDNYILSDKASLACKVIGNMVPPLLMQRVIEANL